MAYLSCQTQRKNGRPFALCAASLVALSVQACSTPDRLDAVPDHLTTSVVVLNIPNGRFFADEQSDEMVQEAKRSLEKELKATGLSPARLPPANFLAVSGGGDDGAFGAGLLNGWTDAGTRPEFKLVTGVSTGALIAPFAFLGKAYDAKLKQVFTSISAKDIFRDRGYLAAINNDALSDTSPLFGLIEKYLDDQMIRDIEREYDKGRLLFIGTTNLDARRPVLWNIGAIAESGSPDAIALIRKILLASAAVPAAFPPVMIDVESGGHHYQEMHVDGGAIAQLFLYPPAVGAAMVRARNADGYSRQRHAFILRNGRLGKDWSPVKRATLPIAKRAISTMIYVSGVNDLYRVYFVTKRDGVDYNLAYIEKDFAVEHPNTDFDSAYMRALFDYGYEKGRNGQEWHKEPPYLEKPPTPVKRRPMPVQAQASQMH